jgi:DNA-binding NarL/FixJ family response regulator
MVFVFIAFLWVGFRRFSFSDAINGLAPMEATTPIQSETDLGNRCQMLSLEYDLTEREAEVFNLLAHGQNGRYIMDHFVVSQNTVKTHVKHIYQKLDIHSQLELIRLVEGRINPDH